MESSLRSSLLEGRPDVDDGVDVGPVRGVFSHRGMRGTGEIIAQGSEPRGRARGIFGVGESEEPEATVRLDDMPQLNGLGVSEADDRQGVKTHADNEPFGEVLP